MKNSSIKPETPLDKGRERAKKMISEIASKVSMGIIKVDEIRYETFTDKFISVIKNATTYVDCGAEYGYYTQLAIHNMPQEKAEIILFEPDPARYLELKQFLSPNPNVKVCPYALTDQNTDNITLYQTNVATSATILKSAPWCASATSLNEFSCKGVSLDDFLEDKLIDVLKMDIDGAEVLAFQGMEKLLAKKHTRIFLEYHVNLIREMDEDKQNVIINLLKKYDYKIYKCSGNTATEIERPEIRIYLVPGHLEP